MASNATPPEQIETANTACRAAAAVYDFRDPPAVHEVPPREAESVEAGRDAAPDRPRTTGTAEAGSGIASAGAR